MTAEQKADELINKFEPLAHKNFTMRDNGMMKKQIKCALICVDETIEALKKIYPSYAETHYWHPIDFWNEVKKILQNK